jgi:hypothetical protein
VLKDLNCFVIMPFGFPFDRYYANIFIPAIQEAGLRAHRADSIFSSTNHHERRLASHSQRIRHRRRRYREKRERLL